MVSRARIEFGDWQTPDDLANHVVKHVLVHMYAKPRTILEPTCGKGAFLVAAARRLPRATLAGYEINPKYAAIAASRVDNNRCTIHTADFFDVDWEQEIANVKGPLLVIGNPPWVTSAGLGTIGSKNLPEKQNFKGLNGLDALTGKSNFDVSEWMILRLIQALSRHESTLAMLCKSAVARRVIEFCSKQGWNIVPGGVWRIDAAKHFQAAVDAVVFVCHTGLRTYRHTTRWHMYPHLGAATPESTFGMADGELIADLEAYQRSRILVGTSSPEWRSGVKHDCARIMELVHQAGRWKNGNGDTVDIEPEFRFPLLKSSDIANGRDVTNRGVVVPQRFLGDDTHALRESAPKLWAYLAKHAKLLHARKSSIYKGKPPFAIFGVGEYSFAPWKVAISGLYKHLRFCVIGPHEKQPVMLDDTCYFLPFSNEQDATRAARALESAMAQDYFRGRVFWDAKRPISKAILQNLDLDRLFAALDRARQNTERA
jgi:methylase of polypeptide subunit release factors